jgi:hypothetical protein
MDPHAKFNENNIFCLTKTVQTFNVVVLGLGLWCLTPFSTIFQLLMVEAIGVLKEKHDL